MLLQVNDLKTYFFTRRGVARAVDGVTFSLKEGEILGLIGESGCGKSVTCLSILRLVPQPAGRIVGGEILFKGENLLSKTEKEMRKIRGRGISMILQDPLSSLNPVFTIGNQVSEALKAHDRTNGSRLINKVIDILGRVKIPSPEVRMYQYPHQMSGGMRQRVVGAIALSCQPGLLLADEPTTSLDATIQLQYLNLLKEIQRATNIAMIFVTHNFGVVSEICDRVAVMYSGKIVENAEVARLFEKPSHPYTIALMKSVPQMDTRVDRLFSIEGQPPDLIDLPAGCAFAPRCLDANDLCRQQYPPQVEIVTGHYVTCWRAGEMTNGANAS